MSAAEMEAKVGEDILSRMPQPELVDQSRLVEPRSDQVTVKLLGKMTRDGRLIAANFRVREGPKQTVARNMSRADYARYANGQRSDGGRCKEIATSIMARKQSVETSSAEGMVENTIFSPGQTLQSSEEIGSENQTINFYRSTRTKLE